jgi:hypothetical protein
VNTIKMAALVLIVAGILGLAYGGFSYTKETHEAKVGPIELTVKDKETVNIPVWAGVGAIAIGGVLLLLAGKRSWTLAQSHLPSLLNRVAAGVGAGAVDLRQSQ